MRILTGDHRGRFIAPSPKGGIRPTSDKIRQALMDSLQGLVPGAHALDLFTGTGALGLEMLSGGATQVYFVDRDASLCRHLDSTVQSLGLSDHARILCADALTEIQRLSQERTEFDCIVADPPYGGGWGTRVLEAISKTSLLKPGAPFILETSKRDNVPHQHASLHLFKTRTYGDTRLHYYTRRSG